MTGNRRVWRWAWNGAAGLSAVMCVVLPVLWYCSYRRTYFIQRVSHYAVIPVRTGAIMGVPNHFGITLYRGTLAVRWWVSPDFDPKDSQWLPPVWEYGWWNDDTEYTALLELMRIENRGICGVIYVSSQGDLFVSIPQWLFVALSAILPALWLIHYRNRPKRLPNHCRQCGYNLTGTLAAGRSECPECGAAVQAKEMAT